MRPLRRLLRAIAIMIPTLLTVGMILQPNRPDCRAIKSEFEGRAQSLLSMHLPEARLQLELKDACSPHSIVNEFEKRWQALSFRMGFEAPRPLSWNELRMKSTRDLLRFQDWGDRSWVIRHERKLAKENMAALEKLLKRYTSQTDPHIDWQRSRLRTTSQVETSRLDVWGQDVLLALATGFEKIVIRAERWNVRDALTAVLVLAAAFSLFLLIGRPYRRMRQRLKHRTQVLPENPPSGFGTGVVFVQAYLEDWRERVEILYETLCLISPEAAHQLLKSLHTRDPDGLFWTIINVSPRLRALLLEGLSAEDWIAFEARSLAATDRSIGEETRGLVRFLVELGKELKRLSGWEQSPLVLHLLTPGDWSRLSADLTRSRRRLLAQKLGAVRATWLRTRNDLHPDWTYSARQGEDETALLQKVRALFELHASQLREHLAADEEIFAAMNEFFAALTLDADLNTDLALLCQVSWHLKQRTLAARATAFDHDLFQVLAALDQESVALVLFDFDEGLRERLLALPHSFPSGVRAHLEAFQNDKLQLKRWKSRSRGLARFIERQLLVHDILLKS